MKRWDEANYNERLFSSGLRGRLHTARFLWLAEQIKKLDCPCDSIVELGCSDAKTIGYLPKPPARYVGFDANWEGNLDNARRTWANPSYSFNVCTCPDNFVLLEKFDIAVCMETFEHLPTRDLPIYFQRLAEATKHYLFVTVPNEKGPVFAAKWIAKRLAGDYEHYTGREFLCSAVGLCDRVPRYEDKVNDHKGFDYANVVRHISNHFDVQSVSGLPLSMLPRQLGFTIGIVAKTRAAGVRMKAAAAGA